MHTITNDTLDKLLQGEEHDPHHILGVHDSYEGKKVIRIFRPGATRLHLEVFGKIVEAEQTDPAGMFEYTINGYCGPLDYRVYHQQGQLCHDPYAFWPTVGELDQYLFAKGVHYRLYNVMGAHQIYHQGTVGIKFVVWAPSAQRVSLVSDFNHWDGRQTPMRCLGGCGIWEIFIPNLSFGAHYKYEIKSASGKIYLKADPYAFSSELRPATASIVADVDNFAWNDHEWMAQRSSTAFNPKPLLIYEVHLGSWKRKDGKFLNYRELAQQLAPYCKEMGFTHVELLPIQEHPLDESWGYQVTGFYAPTSRHGTPEDFQWFIDYLHQNGIGIILDWVPGHFPTDNFSLSLFDGTAIYEHADERQGLHPHWNTLIFNYGRHEVSNFLIANALYWIDRMHIDGLRVDAVASMLYLDYGRNEGEWIPNKFGGKENLEAIEFLKHVNSIVHEQFPGVLMIAEESTSFAGVSHSLEHGGLGFDMKWNMGWMNDTLRYFSKDMLFRSYHHDDLTFGLLYAFSERFISVLSHDEVVHGKRSLLAKMPGDMWQQLANLRLLYSYMICQPGKKLLFMGGEIGQWNEWNCKSEIEWFLLNFPTHKGIQRLVADINHFYLQHPCLWESDSHYSSFQWIDFHDRQNSVVSYIRQGPSCRLLCIHNFTPIYHDEYVVSLSSINNVRELFNSDSEKYGGSNKHCNRPEILRNGHGHSYAARISLAPLATMVFSID